MKTAFISGGSRGIGRATALEFLKNGYKVITTSTTGDRADLDSEISVHKLDLADSKTIEALAKSLDTQNVEVDVLINNAATADKETSLSVENLRKSLETNVIGTVDLTQHLLPLMNKNAVIINLSSEFGSLTEDWGCRVPSYRISKAAINMFTRNIYDCDEVKEKGIKVYSFDPGWVKTDMGGPHAEREPEEPAREILELAESGKESGLFYRGLTVRDW